MYAQIYIKKPLLIRYNIEALSPHQILVQKNPFNYKYWSPSYILTKTKTTNNATGGGFFF